MGNKGTVFLYHGDNEVGTRDVIANPDKDINVHTSSELPDPIRYSIYVNKKNQLIKITQKKSKTSSHAGIGIEEVHEILSFDIDT